MTRKLQLCSAALVFVVGAILLVTVSCGKKEDPKPDRKVDGGDVHVPELLKDVKLPEISFTDITKPSGIRFNHVNGMTGKKLLPETMGSGVAFLDYNNDGKQDLLLINGCPWPGTDKAQPTMKLYRNNGDEKFEDVTEPAGLNVVMYGMGVTCGDYDNDGWIDVFVSGVGGNRLFRNDKGKFTDATAAMQVGGPGGWEQALAAKDFYKHATSLSFASSATFLDYDGDGKLDLFVCNYVTWSPNTDLSLPFTLKGDQRAYGPPTSFEGASCILYRNADSHFEDVSAKAGIQMIDADKRRVTGKSLGVVACDPDRDGWPDIIVANDTVRNFFFHNVPGKNPGERVFEEEGLFSGIAYATSNTKARGAMGIDWGEYRRGLHALIIANFSSEPSTFLRLDREGNNANIAFQDVALSEGIAGKSRAPLKFGAFFFDYDLDGRLDLLTCNGHLEPDIASVQPGQTYAQSAQLFWNTGVEERTYEEITAKQAGLGMFQPIVGRGSAYADIDGDGDLDVVLTANGGPAILLRNDARKPGNADGPNWVRLNLRGDGKRSNVSAIGARVEIQVGEHTYHREVLGARGYLSQSELPITLGLGKADKVDKVTIHWPGRGAGKPQVVENLKINQENKIEQQ